MSVIKNNISRASSLLSLKNFSNNRQSIFSNTNSLNKKISTKFGLFNFGMKRNSNLFKIKNSIGVIPPKEEKKEKIKQYSSRNYKSIIKYIKNLFIEKYSNNYYKMKGNSIYYKNNEFIMYDYYKINDILNNKKCALFSRLKEFILLSNKKEFLIRFYKPKERYIIMKYLLNFIYKFDKLCYDEKKEIPDLETKEEIIKTFFYITSEQYIYEHLFEHDSFKNLQNILKNINLANKKASFDYSYLDITKSTSKENEVIINSLKIINEYINNRNFLEGKLIKNFPIEKVPNIVPIYFNLGLKINIILNDYRKQVKYIKQGKHEKSKELIIKYKKEFSNPDEENNNRRNTLKKELFNIQEMNEEYDNGKSELTNIGVKKKLKNKNYKNILFGSIDYSISKNTSQNGTSKDIENNSIIFNELPNNNLFDINNKRYDNDPDIKDIELFIQKISKEKKVKFRTSNLKLKNEYKNNEKYLSNKKFNKNNAIKKYRISSPILNFQKAYLKLNKRKINEKNIENTKLYNFSSSLFNETNSNKLINYKYRKNLFKPTESFIKDSTELKNKMKIKPNLILRNFSYNKLNSSISGLSPASKRYISFSPENSLKKMRKLYKKTDFEKLVFNMNKRLIISKKKESQSYTFQQILKNCEIYKTKLN